MPFPLKVGKMHFRHMEKIRLKVCMFVTHVCNRFNFKFMIFFLHSFEGVFVMGGDEGVGERKNRRGLCLNYESGKKEQTSPILSLAEQV